MPYIKLVTGQGLMCAYMVSQRTLENVTKEEYAVVVFREVTQFTYGYPNDEALGGHPLYKLGISFYAFNLIEHSPYLAELGRRNAVDLPGTENQFIGQKHLLVSFHDETLEVVCRDVEFLGRVEAWNGVEAINMIEAERVGRTDGY